MSLRVFSLLLLTLVCIAALEAPKASESPLGFGRKLKTFRKKGLDETTHFPQDSSTGLPGHPIMEVSVKNGDSTETDETRTPGGSATTANRRKDARLPHNSAPVYLPFLP